ncbi:NIPA-like protein 3, partial [Entomortierella lignicola]
MPTPSDLCSPQHCTIESSCGSPWQDSDAPQNHAFTGSSMSCCGGQPTGDICSLVGSNVDTCEYQSVCNFDSEDYNGTGTCQAVDEREHVWIGVVITLISSTILNIGLNGQKYALRKHDERRVQKEIEMEEEHERWRQELGWTEDQVQQEADRLYELKENRRGALYRRLKPYMFWRNIFVSKLWLLGLIVFIIGNLGGFIALRFAPQSLTAPLGSIALISNVIIAPLINKEVLGKWDLAGIFFIVAGSVIVVVFSGIVSPDYKLCVLINLFQKTSTIIYLSFIGTCIILTFFFIQFVEKNVENEDDVAIGVSAERVLQKEGRLNRIHSNASNLSLAAKDHQELSLHGVIANSSTIALKDVDGGEGTTAQPKILEEPLEVPARSFAQQPGVALNPSSSHQTTTSDALGKAIGTSSAVGTDHPQEHRRPSFGSSRSSSSSISSLEANTSPGRSGAVDGRSEPKLKFGEPLKSPGASATTAKPAGFTPVGSTVKPDEVEPTRPEISRSQSMATIQSSHRSIRKRRNRTPDLSNTNDGAPFSFWERVKQIEFIPSLPEDKLIRRNSPLLRFCLPLAYAALGGMMASYTVLFAKSLINLLVTSIFNGQNQFTSGLAWVILVVTVITAVSQVYWINMGLKKYDALLQVPVFFTIWVLLDIVGGGIYYGEFSGFTVEKYVLFCIGVLTVFFGVALLAKRLAVLAKEDVGESQIESVHSRRGSVMKEASTGGSRRGSVMREVPRRQSVVDKNEVAVDSRRGSAVQEQGAEGGPSTSV